jgi:DNA-directed RNA polymerase specialized sigma24 family protein
VPGSDQTSEIVEYSKFYVENVPRLVAFLITQGVATADAADCVQECMIDALPPVWGGLMHPYAWCRSVSYRKACALARRGREAPTADPERAGHPLLQPGTELDRFEQDHEFLRQLGQVRGDRQRTVLAWSYDGASPAEIATALQMEPATVRSTLRDARAALRRIRAREGGAPC